MARAICAMIALGVAALAAYIVISTAKNHTPVPEAYIAYGLAAVFALVSGLLAHLSVRWTPMTPNRYQSPSQGY